MAYSPVRVRGGSKKQNQMYKDIDGTLVISVNDWINAGLTYNQFNHDSKNGYLSIHRRGLNGNTLIDVRSITRPKGLQYWSRHTGKLKRELNRLFIWNLQKHENFI